MAPDSTLLNFLEITGILLFPSLIDETSGPIFTKDLSQGLGLKLRLLSQVSAQKLLRLLS